MAKDEQTTSKLVNQHKRMAMGEKITGTKESMKELPKKKKGK